MGLLEGIKSLGRGLGAIPGKLNEARYSHRTVMVPIGVDPDTGEDIEIPEDELISKGMYDPASGQVSMPKSVRTGQSKFGSFLSNGLPRMLDAGLAAATSPGHRTDGVGLSLIRGMQVGSDRLEKRDMMAYQMNRQRRQDDMMDEERASRTAENQAQAERYRRQMEAGPAGAAQRDPTTWEAELVQMHRQAIQTGEMEKANAIADQIKQLSKYAPGASKPYIVAGDKVFDTNAGSFVSPPSELVKPPKTLTLTALQAATAESKRASDSYLMRAGQNIEKALAIAKEDNAPGDVQARLLDLRRRSANPMKTGGRGPQRTPTQQDALEANKQANKFMKDAGQKHDAAIELAARANAPIVVQNILRDAKKKAAPPRTPMGKTPPRLGSGGGSTLKSLGDSYPGK